MKAVRREIESCRKPRGSKIVHPVFFLPRTFFSSKQSILKRCSQIFIIMTNNRNLAPTLQNYRAKFIEPARLDLCFSKFVSTTTESQQRGIYLTRAFAVTIIVILFTHFVLDAMSQDRPYDTIN